MLSLYTIMQQVSTSVAKMNTKPFFFLCFLCALLLISTVLATETSKDEKEAGTTAEQSKADVGLQGWGYGGPGYGYGGWGRGGWGYGGGPGYGYGGWGRGWGGRGGWGYGGPGWGGYGGGWGRGGGWRGRG